MYGSDEDARLEVKRGHAWGAMIFQSNYSAALVQRTEQGRSADDYTIEASDIGINLDMSSELAYNRSKQPAIAHAIDECAKSFDIFEFQINKSDNYCTVTFSSASSLLSTKFSPLAN